MNDFGIDTLETRLRFKVDTLNRRWSNASLLIHRSFDGHIVSMQQSGTHWLRNMLANVLVQLYDLPRLQHIQDDSIIGHTKSPPIYKHIPQIVHSHGCPHALTMRLPGVHFPKYLVLVRELRASLISHYERFKGDYGNPEFAVFLRADLGTKKYYSDIWTRIRFMNEWGRMLEGHPEGTRLIRYEDLRKDTSTKLREVCEFFGIRGVTADVIERAIADSRPEEMAARPNPSVPTTVVRTGDRKPVEAYFDPSNEEFFEKIVARYLHYDFGYGYKLRTSKINEVSSSGAGARVFLTAANDKAIAQVATETEAARQAARDGAGAGDRQPGLRPAVR